MKRGRKKKSIVLDTPRPKQIKRDIKFFYGRHDFPGQYRWWRNDSPGDVFDIIDLDEVKKRVEGAKMCGISTVNHLPGFCELGDDCPDHLGYH